MKYKNRSVFDLTHEVKFSCEMGKLVPIMLEEVVPGDTFKVKTDMMVRLAAMLAPMMHRVNVFTHFFFVPHRLLQTNWEPMITGGEDGEDATVMPTVSSGAGGWAVGSLADYFGLPTGVANLSVLAYPFRAYNLIYNEWYRDQNLQSKVAVSLGDGADSTTSQTLLTRNWEKDYFTSALPWPQRGPSVSIPLGTSAPVIANDVADGNNKYLSIKDPNGTECALQTAAGYLLYNTVALNQTPHTNMHADLSTATAATINDLRQGFQVQRWMEKAARGGSRLVETIFSHFGVRTSDARLQRPEFLGGGRSPIVVSEVLQTSATDAAVTPQGNMAGHAFSAQRSHEFTKSFEEHGYIIGIMSIMPRTAYQQGVPRMWTRTSRLEFYWPEFAHLGEQAILNKEIYAGAASPTGVFGYAPRYDEYRSRFSRVAGQFRSTLNYWHMGRVFSSEPALNSAFVTSDPTKRICAVTEGDNCFVQLVNSVQAIRPIPSAGIPGRIDHD